MDASSRVLIAAADEALRSRIFKRLLDENVFSDTAVDAAHAMQHLEQTSYSVVLLDLDVGIGGAERLIESIGRMPRRRRPVVLVLASPSAARSLDVEVVQVVLRKPLNLRHVVDIVTSCIRVAESSQATPSMASEGDAQPAV